MDTSTLVPAGGAGVLIVALAGYLLRQIPADRQEYRQALADEQARTKLAEARAAAAHRRAELAQQQVDEEREKRRDAESAAATASAQLLTQRQMMQWYAAEKRWMEPYLPPAVGAVLPDPPDQQQEGP